MSLTNPEEVYIIPGTENRIKIGIDWNIVRYPSESYYLIDLRVYRWNQYEFYVKPTDAEKKADLNNFYEVLSISNKKDTLNYVSSGGDSCKTWGPYYWTWNTPESNGVSVNMDDSFIGWRVVDGFMQRKYTSNGDGGTIDLKIIWHAFTYIYNGETWSVPEGECTFSLTIPGKTLGEITYSKNNSNTDSENKIYSNYMYQNQKDGYHLFSPTENDKDFIKTGYTINSWSINKGGNGASYIPGKLLTRWIGGSSKKITLYAQWVANTYTLSFDSNGGNNDDNDQKVYGEYGRGYSWYIPSAESAKDPYGWADNKQVYTGDTEPDEKTDSLLVLPKKENYIFNGYWSAQENPESQYIDEDGKWTGNYTTTFTKDKILYAQWIGNTDPELKLKSETDDVYYDSTSTYHISMIDSNYYIDYSTKSSGLINIEWSNDGEEINSSLAGDNTSSSIASVQLYTSKNRIKVTPKAIGTTWFKLSIDGSQQYRKSSLIICIVVEKPENNFACKNTPWSIKYPVVTKTFYYSTSSEGEVTITSSNTSAFKILNHNASNHSFEVEMIIDDEGNIPDINEDYKILFHQDATSIYDELKELEQSLSIGYQQYNINYKTDYSSKTYLKTDIKNYNNGITISYSSDSEIVPTKENYAFSGVWVSAADRTTEYADGVSVYTQNEDLTLYAVWNKSSYTITYNSNGGFNTPIATSKTINETANITNAVPTKYGYTFLHWNTTSDDSGTVYESDDEYSTNEDLVLYAIWENNNKEASAVTGSMLYPPAVESYQASNKYTEPMIITFTVPEYNLNYLQYIKSVHVSVTNDKNNTSCLTTGESGNESIIPLTIVPWNKVDYNATTRQGKITLNSLYSFSATPDFDPVLYKIQLRFDITALNINDDSNELDEILGTLSKLNSYLITSQNNFSEWSSSTLIKPIYNPFIVMSEFSDNGTTFYKQLSKKFTGTLKFYTVDQETNEATLAIDETDQLESFKMWIGDAEEEEDIEWVDAVSYNTLEQSFNLYDDYEIGSEYTLYVVFKTKNGYTNIDDLTTFNFSLKEASSNNAIEKMVADEEYGINSIYFTAYQDASYELFRAELGSNNWVLIGENNDGNGEQICIQDKFIESGLQYRYGLQETLEKGSFNIARISIREQNESNDFFNATFTRGNKILKTSFDFKISQYSKKHGLFMTETLGGRFPRFTKNGNLNYKQFSISGKISFEDNIDEYFVTLEELLGTSYYEKLKEDNECSNGGVHDILTPKLLHMVDRKFREKAYDWLNDGQAKLFKSGPEGNMIVMLDGITLTPQAALGRRIYDFSAIMYEIAEVNYDNLVAFKIINTD